MIRKAFMRASIPFVVRGADVFSDGFMQSAAAKGWQSFPMQGNFLLKHIDTALTKNAACFEKRFAPMSFTATAEDPKDKTLTHTYAFSVDRAQIYCFNTGVGICSVNIPYPADTAEELLINTCSALHCSAQQTNNTRGRTICCDDNSTYLCCIVKDFLDDLLGASYVMFGTQDDAAHRRIDIFSAALCDVSEDPDAQCNRLCYLLANAYDDRDSALTVKKEDICYQHDYIRWHFSKRGSAVVSNLTGVGLNDAFLQDNWFRSVETNYFYLYIMVMHQKLASYHILNSITADPAMNCFQMNQKALVEFNAKYVFSIVSDEPFVQRAYSELKKATHADDVYAELQTQLSRMFDYARLEESDANEVRSGRLNLISTTLSIVCSLSIISDTASLFRSYGCSFGFDSLRNILFTGVVGLEALLFLGLLVLILIPGRKKKRYGKDRKDSH